jgi:hypothetical protein
MTRHMRIKLRMYNLCIYGVAKDDLFVEFWEALDAMST